MSSSRRFTTQARVSSPQQARVCTEHEPLWSVAHSHRTPTSMACHCHCHCHCVTADLHVEVGLVAGVGNYEGLGQVGAPHSHHALLSIALKRPEKHREREREKGCAPSSIMLTHVQVQLPWEGAVLAACTTAGGASVQRPAQPGSTGLSSGNYLMGANTQMMTTNSQTADIQAAAGGRVGRLRSGCAGTRCHCQRTPCNAPRAATSAQPRPRHGCSCMCARTFVLVGQSRTEMLLRK